MGDFLVIGVENVLGNVAVLSSPGNQFPVTKGDSKLFSKAEADLASAASELTADGNDCTHNLSPPRHKVRQFADVSSLRPLRLVFPAQETVCFLSVQ